MRDVHTYKIAHPSSIKLKNELWKIISKELEAPRQIELFSFSFFVGSKLTKNREYLFTKFIFF